MAKGKKTGGRDWVKGQVTNPLGGGAHNKDLKAVRRLTQVQVAEIASIMLNGTIADLQKITGDKQANIPPDPKATPLQIWFATVAITGIRKGDMHSLSVLLDRTVGKVKDKIELTGNDGGPIKYQNLTEQELETELKRLVDEARRELGPSE